MLDGKKIKSIRRSQGYTPASLSCVCGCSIEMIKDVEADRAQASDELSVMIYRALHLNPPALEKRDVEAELNQQIIHLFNNLNPEGKLMMMERLASTASDPRFCKTKPISYVDTVLGITSLVREL